MVNSGTLSDIFRSEDSESVKCETLSTIHSVDDISSDNSNDADVKFRVPTENNSSTDSSDSKVVKSERSDSPSFSLHLSEELNGDKQHPDWLLGVEPNSPDEFLSESTYISLNTPSLSFEDKYDIFNNDIPDTKLYQNTPDMFAESQEIIDAKVNELINNLVVKTEDNEHHANIRSSSEQFLQNHSAESSQIRSSSDSERHLETSRIPQEEPISRDFQSSQESRVSTEFLDCRERQEEWNSQELTQVSERLELRRKQARRLILTVIRKRQMAEETLDAFKKRLKKF